MTTERDAFIWALEHYDKELGTYYREMVAEAEKHSFSKVMDKVIEEKKANESTREINQ